MRGIPVHIVFIILVLLIHAARPLAQTQPAVSPGAETVESLRSRLLSHISQPRFAAAAWGLKVVSLDTGRVLFEHNADKYFSPASNAKLFTAALALDALGPDYRVKTSLYAAVRPGAAGTLKSDLIVYGRGDPSLSRRFHAGDAFTPLEPLVNALVLAGVRRIEGDLVADESYFQGAPFGMGWQWEDLQWRDGAESSALSINDNVLDLVVKPAEREGRPCLITTDPPTGYVTVMNRTQTVAKDGVARVAVYKPVGENVVYVSGQFPVGSPGYFGRVAVHNPAGLFAAMLKEALARRGIQVTGRSRVIDWKFREVSPIQSSKLVEIGSVESAPLKDILPEVLKPSQNLYAQLLLLQVGATGGQAAESPDATAGRPSPAWKESKGDGQATKSEPVAPPAANPFQTTEERGLESLNYFLRKVGVKKDSVVLEEGAGLSRANLITPSATVELLAYMSRHRWSEIYLSSLPAAGVEGTLQNRMKGTAAAKNVRAKTGTLRHINTLSGYVTTAAGERLAFSILLNNYFNSERAVPARDDIDAVVIMLAGLQKKSGD